MFLTNNEFKRLKNYYLRVDCQKTRSVAQMCSKKWFWDYSKMTSRKFGFFSLPLCHTKKTVKVTTLYIIIQKNYPTPCLRDVMSAPNTTCVRRLKLLN